MNEKDIPEDYKCPITLEIMRDPVSTINGFTYERRAIEESILIKEVEPMTNLPLSSTILLPNTRLKEEIDNFRVSDKKLLKTQVTFDFENHLITLKINGRIFSRHGVRSGSRVTVDVAPVRIDLPEILLKFSLATRLILECLAFPLANLTERS